MWDRRHLLIFGALAPFLAACANRSSSGSGRSSPRSFQLEAGDGRRITIHEWRPGTPAIGAILFSHGANLAPDRYLRIIEPLASAGWRLLAPLHTDSEQHPDRASYAGLATWRTRIEDMRALSSFVGGESYVAMGHSFGALTALALGGAEAVVPDGVSGSLADPRARAVVAFSPPPPIPSLITYEGYSRLAVPALIQTGTLDVPLLPGMAEASWEGHLAPFEAAAPGQHRYALVLEGVDHYFGGGIGRLASPEPLADRHLDVAVAIAREFTEAYGLGRSAARARLRSRMSGDLPIRLIDR